MLPFLLLGCDPWELPDGGSTSIEPLWDSEVVAADDGVYVRLPNAERLVRVTPDGAWAEVDLDGASPDRLVAVEGGNGLFVSATWPVCDDDDPAIVYVDDCPESKLSYESEMVLVQNGERVGGRALEGVAPQLNAAAFSHNGEMAALYLDFESGDEVSVSGFVNLNEVAFVDLSSGEVNRVSVGFAAEAVLFSENDKVAVVLSRSQVAVVNLKSATEDCAAWERCVSYPLTLDPDTAVVPSGVVLVDDGAYALVSVAGKKDVYVLDLVTESIDLLELDAVPSAMVDDPVAGATVFVYANSARADIVDHLFFELQSVTLDEPATDAVQTELGTLLYNTHGTYHDVITLDAATGDWHEQRAENPVMQLELVGESYAVATMSPDSYSNTGGTGGFYDEHYGFGIFPLAPVTGENPRDPVSVVLESQPVGLATTSDGVQHFALLLLDGVDSLLKVNVTDASAQQIDLEAAPLGILPSPDGRFVVTGDSAIGMVSFVNPDSDTPTTVAGFATLGLAERHRLPRRESQE